jgi:hypothetical protein
VLVHIFLRQISIYLDYTTTANIVQAISNIKVGITKGFKLTTKKSTDRKKIILKHSKDFGGTLTDLDVIKLCGCSRQSYYKYKSEIKTEFSSL